MLKFFRRIRKKLLYPSSPSGRKSNFSKYLMYAIGEIILVVIGILIAVGINSMYNSSQNENKIQAILKQVQQELVVDINDAKRIYDFYIDRDSLFRKIMNDTMDFKSYQNDPYQLLITQTYVSFSNKKGGYLRIMDNIENLPANYNTLLPHFSSLYIEMQNDIDDYNTFIKNTAMIQTREFTNKYPKFADYQFGRYPGKMNEVLFRDPDLKNLTFNFMNDLRNISQASNSYRSESIILYKKIDSLLGSTPKEYRTPLSTLPSKEDYEGYLGRYKNIVGQKNNELNIILKNGYLLFKQSQRDDLKMYWHKEDYYYFSEFGVIIRLYKDDTGNQLIEVKSNRLHDIYQKI